jgi:hypothetical protein
MIDTYPNAEQIWFIRDIFYRDQLENNTLTDSEKELVEQLRPLLQSVENQCSAIVNLVEKVLEREVCEKLRNELDPFQRKGVLFLGAGHFSEYGNNRLHEMLQDILSLVNNAQQNSESDDTKIAAQDELKRFLIKFSEKIGLLSTITFENPSN